MGQFGLAKWGSGERGWQDSLVVVRVEEWRLGVSEQNRRGGTCGSLRKSKGGGDGEEDQEVEVLLFLLMVIEEECAKRGSVGSRKHLKIEEKTSQRSRMSAAHSAHDAVALREGVHAAACLCRLAMELSLAEANGRNLLLGEEGSSGLRTTRARCLFQAPDFSRGKNKRVQALGSGFCRVLLRLLVGLGVAAGSFSNGRGLVRVGSRCRAPPPRPARLARPGNLWHCRISCSSLRIPFHL